MAEQFPANPTLKDFARLVPERPPHHLVLGIVLECAAWLGPFVALMIVSLLLTGIALLMTWGDPSSIKETIQVIGLIINLVAFAIFITTLLLFAWKFMPVLLLRPIDLLKYLLITKVRRLAKRYRFNPRAKLLNDERAPILFLRSFVDDKAGNRRRQDWKTAEELFAKVFDRVGPVIAVGMPGEQLPLLGAVRMYFKDADWQNRVRSLMSLAKYVVIQVPYPSQSEQFTQLGIYDGGYSKGLLWEMQTARATLKLKPESLIFSFVGLHDLERFERQIIYQTFKSHAEKLYSVQLPEEFGNAYLLQFKRDWGIRLIYVNLGWKKWVVFNPAKAFIKRALKQLQPVA